MQNLLIPFSIVISIHKSAKRLLLKSRSNKLKSKKNFKTMILTKLFLMLLEYKNKIHLTVRRKEQEVIKGKTSKLIRWNLTKKLRTSSKSWSGVKLNKKGYNQKYLWPFCKNLELSCLKNLQLLRLVSRLIVQKLNFTKH